MLSTFQNCLRRWIEAYGNSTVAPGHGEADDLNVPAWLWPELTMHLGPARK